MNIVELYIDDEDELSGVDALSLVENPATHYEWEIFSDESECGDECKLKHYFSDKGEDLKYLINHSSKIEVRDIDPYKFYTIDSRPNTIDTGDGFNNQVIRYYYAVELGRGATLIKESRKLCRELIRKDLVYRNEDLTQLSSELTADGDSFRLVPRTAGTSVDLKIYKSGKYCRHIFREIIFTLPEGISASEFVKDIPKRAKSTINSRIGGMTSRPKVQNQIGRGGVSEWSIYMSEDYEGVIDLLEGLCVYSSIDALFKGEPDCEAICFIEYENGKRGYIGGIPENEHYFNEPVKVLNSVKIENFESYTDYPEYISENAKRGIELNEKVDNKCATQTGKIRAQQLANREPISEETIVRMYSYLSRAGGDYDPNDTEACGTISVLLWGGLEAKDWCERKLNQIREEMKFRMGCVQEYLDKGYGEEEAQLKCYREYYPDTEGFPDNVLPLSSQFSTPHLFKDELNYEVTTVVMEANRYIPRRSEMGDIYYVFFKPETIKSMLKKFYKQNKHKNFNYEHSGLQLDGGYVYESWLVVDSEMDKSKKLGFTVNPGTWMATIKFDNKEIFEKYILSRKTLGISLEGSFMSRPVKMSNEDFEKIGELDGLPIFNNPEEARRYGIEKYGCAGVHQHREGEYMPCEAHDILINSLNGLYKNKDEVFMDELKNIINKTNL